MKGKYDEADFSEALATQGILQNKDTYRASIYLPLTNALTENLKHEYTEQRGAVSNILNTLMGKADSAVSGVLGSNYNVQTAINDISNFTGSRTILINPDYVQTYKGAAMRGVQLTWSLVPKNDKEVESIFNIIRSFKEYSSPKIQIAASLLTAPMFCTITFNNKMLDGSVRFEEMVIESVDVNYSETGFMETYHDGAPKAITLDIKFLERRMKTQKDWTEVDTRKKREEIIKITTT